MRSYVMAGAALAGGSLIAVSPIAPPPDIHVASAAMRLVAGEATGDDVALIMSGATSLGGSDPTGQMPTPEFVTAVYDRFINPTPPFFTGQHVFPGFTPIGLPASETAGPFTGLFDLPFNQSVAQASTDLNTAITQTYAGQDIVVLGYSQSTVVTTLEMNALDALPADQRPSPDDLHFVLLGDLNNPDGGVFERFSSLGPMLNEPFLVATAPDTPYPTDIYTIEYDGVADFPQYPSNLLADLNAGVGSLTSHLAYPTLTPDQLAAAQLLPGSVDLTGVGETNYYLIPAETLPLLQPLQDIGATPLVDLMEPGLKYIVDLGYDRTGDANVPTPVEMMPNIDPNTFMTNLDAANMQGLNQALADLGLSQMSAAALPQLPSLLPSVVPLLSSMIGDQAGSTDLLGSLGGDMGTLLSDLSAGLTGTQLAGLLDPTSFLSLFGL